jgi:type IV pilus assembly protein PilB
VTPAELASEHERRSARAAHGPRELAELHALDFIDLRATQVDRLAAETLPLDLLVRSGAIPYRIVDGRLKVAISDPRDIAIVDELRLVSSTPIDFAVASPLDIEFELRLLARAHEVGERAAAIEDVLPASFEESDDLDTDGPSDAPPIRLVNSIIVQAIEDRASDLHFLPQGDALVARLRVDGIMHEVERIPKRHAAGVISRVKVLAKLDIAEHRLPQDGRFTLRPKSREALLEVRVAIVPTVEGEGAILRLLDKSRRSPTLTDVGLSNEMQMRLEEILYRPTGAFLTVGPTGSGKSTTVYAALSDINRPEINIVTVEDPVEYRVDDVYQVQVNNRAGLTFATGLRSILRADPDVIMVGEIRDLETAKITLEAALTGHGVLSTMHTNDAAGAITRLNDLGIEPYMTGSALNAVLSQRLVRRLCLECREPYELSRRELEDYGFDAAGIDAGVSLYRRRGCSRCTKGYVGRIGVYQLMDVDEDVARLAVRRAGHAEIVAAAHANGMRSLWADGLEKVAAGITTIEELVRIAR